MNIDQLNKQYWFHDGAIMSFHLDILNSRVEIVLHVRRISKERKPGPLQEQDLSPCTLQLICTDLIEVSLFERFPTQGYYLNFTTINDSVHGIELSFNVHDSSSYVYEKDNWVIKAKQIKWKEVGS